MLTGHHATLAQSVERLTRNEQVDSSILSSGSVALDVQASRVLRIAGIFAAGSPESLQGAGFARVAELVDAQDLGSCVFDVWVQVPSRAHNSMLCPFFLGCGLKGVCVVGFCFFRVMQEWPFSNDLWLTCRYVSMRVLHTTGRLRPFLLGCGWKGVCVTGFHPFWVM